MATEQWFRAARQGAAEKFVQRAGLKPEELTAMLARLGALQASKDPRKLP